MISMRLYSLIVAGSGALVAAYFLLRHAQLHGENEALTGWQVLLRQGARPAFNARLHDPRPQTLLGKSVNDVDSVVNAAVDHPATATFIAGKIAAFFLGPDVDSALVNGFAATFRAGNFELRPVVRAVLQAGLDGKGGSIVQSPLVWWVATRRATAIAPDPRTVVRYLDSAGQVPGNPPNAVASRDLCGHEY